MGSGKTTIGQRVAKQLEMEFLDCDRYLENQTGASVNLIFDVEGESGFRKRESRMLQALTSRQNVLIATGGGAVLREKKPGVAETDRSCHLPADIGQSATVSSATGPHATSAAGRGPAAKTDQTGGSQKSCLRRTGRYCFPFPESWPGDRSTKPDQGHLVILGTIFITGRQDRSG